MSSNVSTYFVCFLAVFAIAKGDGDDVFNYDDKTPFGPSKWVNISAACGGPRQSPINIRTKRTILANDTVTPLVISKFDELPVSALIKNNGHSLVIKMTYCDGESATFTGGPLGEAVYTIDR